MEKYKPVFPYTLFCLLIIGVVFFSAIYISTAEAVVTVSDVTYGKQLVKLDEENHVLKDKIEYNSEIMEQYKYTITEEDRNTVGDIVLAFVAAQYSNDKEKMYSLCSDKLKGKLKKDQSLAKAYEKDVQLKLVIVSNIVKLDGKYMAFIRIEDSRADSQYQENFYLEKMEDKFFITMIEQDM